MNNQKPRLRLLAEGGLIAALYVVLTMLVPLYSFGQVQLRLSEALTILPIFTAAAVPGLTVGCLLANVLGVALAVNGAGPWDILFGTLATLLAALLTRRLREVRWFGLPVLASLMPVVFNALIVGLELALIYTQPFTLLGYTVSAVWVGLGELAAATVGGLILCAALEKTGASRRIFAPAA